MKYNHFIFLMVFLAIIIGGGAALTASNDDGKNTEKATQLGKELVHNNNDDHDDDGKHEEKHIEESSHSEKEGHEDDIEDDDRGHSDEAGIIEITEEQQKEIGLVISIAHSGDIEQILSLVGEVRLNEDRMAHLVPRVPGIVNNVNISLGDYVREGQVLATIDSPELTELKADYLEKLRNLELTRRTFERKEYLKKENIASEADWLEAKSAYQNAETMLHSAKRRLIFIGLTEKEIYDLPNAKDEAFGRYELKSPLDGTIITKHITRGEKIDEEEVFTVADLSKVWVDLQIPAQDLDRVKEGLHILLSSTEGELAEGKLSLIGPVVHEESRTVLGRVVLPNPNGKWKPGIFVKGQIHSETPSSAVVVPSEAVQNIEGEDVIFVPDGDGFKPIDVALGKSIKGKTEILAGIKAGDRYVSKGAFELKAIQVTSGAGAHAGHGH
jgi:cobalt-zinc-cadmium efflux system membrane fusion protein